MNVSRAISTIALFVTLTCRYQWLQSQSDRRAFVVEIDDMDGDRVL